MREGAVVLGLLVVAAGACGGEVTPAGPPDADVFGDAATPPPASLDTLLVPAGMTDVGSFLVDVKTRAWSPAVDCSYDGVVRRFYVNSFRLMRTEVTHAMWADCMQEGACDSPKGLVGQDVQDSVDPPADPAVPVSVTWAQARSFCQQYGGDLPSDAQWTRAATGGTPGWGIPAVRAAWDRCLAGASDAICADLARETRAAGQNGRAPVAVGTTSWDVGPYGHVDLWGNAGEWTRSAAARLGEPEFCTLQDGSADPVSYLPQSTFGTAFSWQLGDVLGFLLAQPDQQATSIGGNAWIVHPALSSKDLKDTRWKAFWYTGFRCAFPAGD